MLVVGPVLRSYSVQWQLKNLKFPIQSFWRHTRHLDKSNLWRKNGQLFITQVAQNVTKIVVKSIQTFAAYTYATFDNFWLFNNSSLKRTTEKSIKSMFSILHCWEPSRIWSRPAYHCEQTPHETCRGVFTNDLQQK